MKGRALVNIDESCHSTLLTGAHLEMREMTFMLSHPNTGTEKAYTIPYMGCFLIKGKLFAPAIKKRNKVCVCGYI